MTGPQRLLLVGGCHRDLVGRTDAAFEVGTSCPGRIREAAGGVARNVAVLVASVGPTLSARLVSRVGTDAAGAALITGLEESGVDASGVLRSPEAATGTYVALHGPDGDLVAGLSDLAVYEGLTVACMEGLAAAVADASIVFADANLPPKSLDRLAVMAGPRLAVDAISRAKVRRVLQAGRAGALVFANRLTVSALTAAPPADTGVEAEDAGDDISVGVVSPEDIGTRADGLRQEARGALTAVGMAERTRPPHAESGAWANASGNRKALPDGTEAWSEAPAVRTENQGDRPAVWTEACGHHPVVRTKARGDDPAVRTEARGDDPAIQTEAWGEGPAIRTETRGDDPAVPTESQGDNPAIRTEAWSEGPAVRTETQGDDPAVPTASRGNGPTIPAEAAHRGATENRVVGEVTRGRAASGGLGDAAGLRTSARSSGLDEAGFAAPAPTTPAATAAATLPAPAPAQGAGRAVASAQEAAEILRDLGVRRAVVTDGPRPLALMDDGRIECIAVPPAAVVDVTGAGDALIAGTLAALALGADTRAAVWVGVRAAAAALGVSGALDRLPTAVTDAILAAASNRN